MHVLSEQFSRVVIAEQAHSGTITEKSGTLSITTKNRFSSGIEYEPNSLLAIAQRLFRFFSFSDVFRERHQESRHAFSTGNEESVVLPVVVHPDQAAIFAPVLLLDLKLLPFCPPAARRQAPSWTHGRPHGSRPGKKAS